jgi:hypothetical protein
MTEEKKKVLSKKELLRQVEALDKNKVFDLVSLGRTNIANIKACSVLLKG